METPPGYAAPNDGKQDFGRIYNRSDARSYFQTLQRVDYAIPAAAQPIFKELLDTLMTARDADDVTILDLGCSYGINAALLKYDLNLQGLYDYYDGGDERPFEEAIEEDRQYFRRRDADDSLTVIGLDTAERAVDYGVATGLLDEGIAANLETSPLSDHDADKIRDCDLVTSTGCIGYVTERTFRQLLPHLDQGTQPWFANFVLRMFPYEPIKEVLSKAEFKTRKLEGVLFPQRRFTTPEERQHTVSTLEQMGLDPGPELSADCYYAELFLSQPSDEASDFPLTRLAALTDNSMKIN